VRISGARQAERWGIGKIKNRQRVISLKSRNEKRGIIGYGRYHESVAGGNSISKRRIMAPMA